MTIKILAFSGSLRAESFNKRLLKVASYYLNSIGVQVDVVDLNDFNLAVYNQDVEQQEGLPVAALYWYMQ